MKTSLGRLAACIGLSAVIVVIIVVAHHDRKPSPVQPLQEAELPPEEFGGPTPWESPTPGPTPSPKPTQRPTQRPTPSPRGSPSPSPIPVIVPKASFQLYVPNYLKRALPGVNLDDQPSAVFSGRSLKFKTSVPFASDKILLTDRTSGKQTPLEVKKKTPDSFVVDIPVDQPTGSCALSFTLGGTPQTFPIEIQGLTEAETALPPAESRIVRKSTIPGKADPIRFRTEIPGADYWEMVFAGHPTDPMTLVQASRATSLYRSQDGGRSWVRVFFNIFDVFYAGDPKLVTFDDGTFLLSGVASGNGSGGVVYRGNWRGDLQAVLFREPSHGPINVDRPVLVGSRDGAAIYIVALRGLAAVNKSGFSYEFDLYLSNDGARTFSSTTLPGSVPFLRSLVIGSDDTLYGAGLLLGEASLVRFRSFDPLSIESIPLPVQGSRWPSPRVSTKSNRAWESYQGPELVADTSPTSPHYGRLYVIFAIAEQVVADPDFEQGRYGKNHDVFVVYSDNRGERWSAPVRVNDDIGQGDQLFPSPRLDATGTLHMAWLDHREHPAQPLVDVYYAYSVDGGAHFSKNLKVSKEPIGIGKGGRVVGDYLDMIMPYSDRVYIAHPCGSLDGVTPKAACLVELAGVTKTPPLTLTLTPSGHHVIEEGKLLTITVAASDGEKSKPTLTARLANGFPVNAIGATLTDNGNGTGTFQWVPGFDVVAAPASQKEVQIVLEAFAASDQKELLASQLVTITVKDTKPITNQPLPMTMNTARLISPKTDDRFTAPATITLETEVKVPETITIVGVIYVVDGTPKAFEVAKPYRYSWTNVPAGTYKVKARAVTPGGTTIDTTETTITVQDAQPNRPPDPTLAIMTPNGGESWVGGATVTLRWRYTQSVTASGDVVSRPTTLMLLPGESADPHGTIPVTAISHQAVTILGDNEYRWTIPESLATGAPYRLVVHVLLDRPLNGNRLLEDVSDRSFTIQSAPRAPLIKPIPDQTVAVGESKTFTLRVSDPNGPPLNFVIATPGDPTKGLPKGVAIRPNPDKPGEAILMWPVTDQPGVYPVRIIVDPARWTTAQRFTVTVQPANPLRDKNQRPTVRLTSPTYGMSFRAPATITLRAEASDADGTVAWVRLDCARGRYGTTECYHEDREAPYEYVWSNVPAGSYTIQAFAYDEKGAWSASSVEITVAANADGQASPRAQLDVSLVPHHEDSAIRVHTVTPNSPQTRWDVTIGPKGATEAERQLVLLTDPSRDTPGESTHRYATLTSLGGGVGGIEPSTDYVICMQEGMIKAATFLCNSITTQAKQPAQAIVFVDENLRDDRELMGLIDQWRALVHARSPDIQVSDVIPVSSRTPSSDIGTLLTRAYQTSSLGYAVFIGWDFPLVLTRNGDLDVGCLSLEPSQLGGWSGDRGCRNEISTAVMKPPVPDGTEGRVLMKRYFRRLIDYYRGTPPSHQNILYVSFIEEHNPASLIDYFSKLPVPANRVRAPEDIDELQDDLTSSEQIDVANRLYADQLRSKRYDFVFLNAHGSPAWHQPDVDRAWVQGVSPKAATMIAFSCSIGDFRQPNYISGAYVFDGEVLSVIASPVIVATLSPVSADGTVEKIPGDGVVRRLLGGTHTVGQAAQLVEFLVIGDPFITLDAPPPATANQPPEPKPAAPKPLVEPPKPPVTDQPVTPPQPNLPADKLTAPAAQLPDTSTPQRKSNVTPESRRTDLPLNTAIIRLVSPTATDRFVAPATIPLETEVIAPEGRAIHSVFYTVDGKSLAVVETPPYRYNWTSVPAGTYKIKATAVTPGFAVIGSDEMTITVAQTAAQWATCQPGPASTAQVQLRATIVDTGVRIDITGPADTVAYELLVADAVTGPWQPATTTPIPADNGRASWVDVGAPAPRFYRAIASGMTPATTPSQRHLIRLADGTVVTRLVESDPATGQKTRVTSCRGDLEAGGTAVKISEIRYDEQGTFQTAEFWQFAGETQEFDARSFVRADGTAEIEYANKKVDAVFDGTNQIQWVDPVNPERHITETLKGSLQEGTAFIQTHVQQESATEHYTITFREDGLPVTNEYVFPHLGNTPSVASMEYINSGGRTLLKRWLTKRVDTSNAVYTATTTTDYFKHYDAQGHLQMTFVKRSEILASRTTLNKTYRTPTYVKTVFHPTGEIRERYASGGIDFDQIQYGQYEAFDRVVALKQTRIVPSSPTADWSFAWITSTNAGTGIAGGFQDCKVHVFAPTQWIKLTPDPESEKSPHMPALPSLDLEFPRISPPFEMTKIYLVKGRADLVANPTEQDDLLVLPDQTIQVEGRTVRVEYNGGLCGALLLFNSNSGWKLVNYPAEQTVSLNGRTYQIGIDSQGIVTLTPP